MTRTSTNPKLNAVLIRYGIIAVLAIVLVAGAYWIWQTQIVFPRATAARDEAVKLVSQAKYQEALDLLAKHQKALQKDLTTQMVLGVSYYNLGKGDEAIAAYQQAIKTNPKYAPAYNNLANVYRDAGRHDLAEEQYRKAIEANAQFLPAYMNLAGDYVGRGLLLPAIDVYNLALKQFPNEIELQLGLADTYFALGQKDTARIAYQKALEIDPNNAYAKAGLDRVK